MRWLLVLAAIAVVIALVVVARRLPKPTLKRALWWLLPIAAVATAAVVAWHAISSRGISHQAQQMGGGKSCGTDPEQAKKTCGAEDPVSDPDYNMREIVKQSILLEEHLVEKNKRCKDCIVKHFLHIIALAEEAQCLAGSKLSKYPYMDDSPAYYKKQYERWMANRDDDQTYRKVDDQLRKRRKLLVAYYILGDGVTGTPHLDG